MTRAALRVGVFVAALTLGCSEPDAKTQASSAEKSELVVQVRLDGLPATDAVVLFGGDAKRYGTNAEGVPRVPFEPKDAGGIGSDAVVMAAHIQARTRAVELAKTDGKSALIELTRLDPEDNPDYAFRDPGEPKRRDTTEQCGHCHPTINTDWFASPHRTSAKNPVVVDLYAGTSSAYATQAECEARGGAWQASPTPGTGQLAERCQLGDGVLSTLNPCSSPGACPPKQLGACADCHAPGIDGVLGGRNLLDARGFAYDYGAHCDVCHRVESIAPKEPAGVAGRLRLLRPSEASPSPGLGDFMPVTFGPWLDVPIPLMGGVERAHFHDGQLCAGCHQLEQPALVPGVALDSVRWPSGSIPVHSTVEEWQRGPLAASPCPSCHMPPDPGVGNGADLYNEFEGPEGVAAGWKRPPGSVRRHSFLGPRTPESGFSRLAAAVFIEKSVSAGELSAKVTVKNVGCGHALPTGEPLRSLVLLVSARCGDKPLDATGGDAVPDFGGYRERKEAGQDWTLWSAPKVGERVRVIRRTGAFRDYQGFGPFGDGRFTKAQKGLAEEVVAGSRTIEAVQGGKVSFDGPLPSGDVAYRVDAPASVVDGGPALTWAGAAGFAFARVLVGADGRRMVPHFLAVDVASDNRILPQHEVTTTHRFANSCPDPEVTAVLVHRAYPFDLARARGFSLVDGVIAEAVR